MFRPFVDLSSPKRWQGIANVAPPNAGYNAIGEVPANVADAPPMLGMDENAQVGTHINPRYEFTLIAKQLADSDKTEWTNDLNNGMLAFVRRGWNTVPQRTFAVTPFGGILGMENAIVTLPHVNYHFHRLALDSKVALTPEDIKKDWFLAGCMETTLPIEGAEAQHRAIPILPVADTNLANIWDSGVNGDHHLFLVFTMVEVGSDTAYVLDTKGRQVVYPGNMGDSGNRYVRYVPKLVPAYSKFNHLQSDPTVDLSYSLGCETRYGIPIYVGYCRYNMNNYITRSRDIDTTTLNSPCMSMEAYAKAETIGVQMQMA